MTKKGGIAGSFSVPSLSALLPILVGTLVAATAARAQTVVPVSVGDRLVLAETELRSDDSTVDFFDPSFAPRPGGGFLAGWARVVNGADETDRIDVEAYNRLDRQVGPTRLVSTDPAPPADAERNVALAAAGPRVAATWLRHESGPEISVQLRILNPQGQATSPQLTAGTSDTGLQPAVALSPSGRALVAWSEVGAGGFDLVGRVFDAQGDPVTGELELDGGVGISGVPSLGVDDQGRFLVAWADGSGPSGTGRIHAHWIDSDGQTSVPPYEVSAGPASRPDAAVSPDGLAVVTWSQCAGSTTGQTACQVRYRLLGTDGLPLGPPQVVSPPGGRIHELPAVGITDDGDFAVAWRACRTSTGTNRFDCRVTASFHGPDGERYGNRLQKERDGEPVRFTVVPLGDDFVVGWFRFSCDSQTCDPGFEGVHAQRYRLVERDVQADEAFPDVPAEAPELATPEIPDFRFWVRIGRPGSDVFGSQEPTCLPETICVSGALPGRTELFLRVIGPRPNGFLWPTVVKFTASTVEIWVEQISTGAVQYYGLDGAVQGSSDLPGLFDRTGFEPGQV